MALSSVIFVRARAASAILTTAGSSLGCASAPRCELEVLFRNYAGDNLEEAARKITPTSVDEPVDDLLLRKIGDLRQVQLNIMKARFAYCHYSPKPFQLRKGKGFGY